MAPYNSIQIKLTPTFPHFLSIEISRGEISLKELATFNYLILFLCLLAIINNYHIQISKNLKGVEIKIKEALKSNINYIIRKVVYSLKGIEAYKTYCWFQSLTCK